MSETCIKLLHGTDERSAGRLLKDGWTPGSGAIRASFGQPCYLYLTTEPENALWFAEQRAGDVVLEIRVLVSDLIVDPEDGVGENVAEEFATTEITGLPANFALTAPVRPEDIVRHVLSPR